MEVTTQTSRNQQRRFRFRHDHEDDRHYLALIRSSLTSGSKLLVQLLLRFKSELKISRKMKMRMKMRSKVLNIVKRNRHLSSYHLALMMKES